MENRMGFIMFVLAGLVMFFAGPSLAAEGQNLLSNGGFEDGLTGWTPDPAQELVSGADKACAGKACLSGEVSAANKALRLVRTVGVKAGCLYEFRISARVTGGVKLGLFVNQPGAGQPTPKTRERVALWEDLTPRWKEYTATVPVAASGTLRMEIIAPSSFGGGPGRIWIDEIALYEKEAPSMLKASEGKGFNDEPALGRAEDGSLYLAWNSFRDGADSLQVARYEVAGKEARKTGAWQVAGGKGTYILGPRVVPAGKEVFVLYAAEVDRNWDIYAAPCGPKGPGAPIRVSSAPAVDVKPAGAWHEGVLHVAWESNPQGWRQVFAASVRDGKAGEPAPLTSPGASNYNPSVAVLRGGHVAVAWHSFRDNNYDVYLRRLPAGGQWEAERRLTRAATIDRHPLLQARGDDLWLVYENAAMGPPTIDSGPDTRGYAIGSTRTRRLIVAQVGPKGLLAPKNYATASPVFTRHSEAPAAAFDESGRLWLACRSLGATEGAGKKAKPRSWLVSLTALDGQGWAKPATVSHAPGMDRYSGLALAGGRAWVAYQAEGGISRYDNEEQSKSDKSDVYLVSVAVPPAGAGRSPDLAALAEPADAFPPGVIRVARGEDQPASSITCNGQKLNLYFGDLHDHTEVSQCNRTGDESVDESYANMRDIVRHDFACATDHGYNITPYLWYYLSKLARTNDDPGRYLTFLAEEWTSSFEETSAKHPYGFYGHRNLIFADPYFPRWWNARNRQTPAQVWEDLRKMNANFVHIPHQLADTGNVPTDWDFADETAQPVAEIFQGRGSYEYKGTPRMAKSVTPTGKYFLQDAWARGIVIGVIASPDHTGGYGKACVYAPQLTREAILDGLRARRCYGTTAAKIILDVRVDGHLMGEKVAAPAGKTVEVKITASCPGDIERIEVCRNNQFIYTTSPAGRTAEVTFTDRAPLPGRSYYYVRVLQKDGEIAWSSPVWLGAE